MNATIISIGTELITGQCIDTNAAWISQRLLQAGVDVALHVTVGDSREALVGTIRQATDSGGVIVMTGGLGPTRDDMTRAAIASALGADLQESPEALSQIEGFFKRWRREPGPGNRVQAMMPMGCEIVPNQRGTAPGICYRASDCLLFALPGVPSEMKAMFDEAVLPIIADRSNGPVVRLGRLNCFGVYEADVGKALEDLMAPDRNPSVGTTASEAVISVRIVARGETAAAAEALLGRDVDEVVDRLGNDIFSEGDEPLEAAVARVLAAGGWQVATAESCTGGLLSARLTSIPGSSAYFKQGFITYANEAKTKLLGVLADTMAREGAVSQFVAEQMAAGSRQAAAADFGIGITGIAGPDGGTEDKPVGLVWIALAHAGGIASKRCLFGDHLSRSAIRDRAAKTALNMLRLRILEQGAGA